MDSDFGMELTDFGYGLSICAISQLHLRPEYRSRRMDHVAFDERTSSTRISCYADAGFTSLKYQESHGAHVMDVLAGDPTSSRIGPCLRATVAIRRVGSQAPTLLRLLRWCLCTSRMTTSVTPPAYGCRST